MFDSRKVGFQPIDLEAKSARMEECVEFLSRRVIGQNNAIEHLADGLKQYWAGIKDPSKPIGTFMFLGPTGWGKTLIAEQLAQYLVPNSPTLKPFTKISGETHKESHQLASLIGSPPGYIGYFEPAYLSQRRIDDPAFQVVLADAVKRGLLKPVKRERVTRKQFQDVAIDPMSMAAEAVAEREKLYRRSGPYVSVVLFDEFEKFHPNIDSSLLSAFDKGQMLMADGTMTDFSNTVFILTSNIGARDIQDSLRGKSGKVGFSLDLSTNQQADLQGLITERAMSAMKDRFAPELIGRIGEHICVFNPLPIDECLPALDIMLADIQKRIPRQRYMTLRCTLQFKEFVLQQGYSREYGLRPLQQAVNKHVLGPVSTVLLTDQTEPGDELLFSMHGAKPRVQRRDGIKLLPAPRHIGEQEK